MANYAQAWASDIYTAWNAWLLMFVGQSWYHETAGLREVRWAYLWLQLPLRFPVADILAVKIPLSITQMALEIRKLSESFCLLEVWRAPSMPVPSHVADAFTCAQQRIDLYFPAGHHSDCPLIMHTITNTERVDSTCSVSFVACKAATVCCSASNSFCSPARTVWISSNFPICLLTASLAAAGHWLSSALISSSLLATSCSTLCSACKIVAEFGSMRIQIASQGSSIRHTRIDEWALHSKAGKVLQICCQTCLGNLKDMWSRQSYESLVSVIPITYIVMFSSWSKKDPKFSTESKLATRCSKLVVQE